MKPLLALLISCLSLSAATTYPVLSTTTSRTIVGGVTNLPHLNSNNVFTGTMRATGAVTLTNASNVFAGDGSGLTGISSVTNLGNGANTVEATNLFARPSGGTNWSAAFLATNGTTKAGFDKDGRLILGNGGTFPGTPGYTFATDTSSGLLLAVAGYPQIVAGTAFDVIISGTIVSRASAADVRYNNPMTLMWGAGGAGSSMDVGITRSAAGVIEVNSGTSGVYRDLTARTLLATNLHGTNLVINGGATVTGILSTTATLNFDLSAVTVEDLTMTVTGAAVGDVVTLGVPNGSVTTSVQYTAWVSAADTVTVRARTSATGEDPASGTFRVTVIKH